MNQPIINLAYHEHKKRQAREKLLVSRICALSDKNQVKVLGYIEHLEIETAPGKAIEYD